MNIVDPFGEQACDDQKDCIEATNYKPPNSDGQTVVQSERIDAVAATRLPEIETTGLAERGVRFDEADDGSVSMTETSMVTTIKGDTIESTMSGIGGADAIGHSHPNDKSDPSPGPYDDLAPNRGFPSNVVHNGNVIVIEKVNGQFRVRVLADKGLTKSDRKEIQRDVNKFQKRAQK